MAYCTESDLLLGDLIVSDSVDQTKFVNEAADEIDSKLGFIYTLPLTPLAGGADWEALPHHEVLTLRTINIRLATGRLILSLAAAGEDTQLHAYGSYLVQEAQADLMAIANGVIDLSATRLYPTDLQADRTPRTVNHDEESLLDGFEKNVLRSEPWYTIPGQVP